MVLCSPLSCLIEYCRSFVLDCLQLCVASTCVYSTYLHVCSPRPCVCARVRFPLCYAAALLPGAILPPCGMHPAVDRLQSRSAHTRTHILGDAHQLGQYGCAYEEKKNVSYTYERVFCIPPGKLEQTLCISLMQSLSGKAENPFCAAIVWEISV